jgi:tetratricopeptide (TPR) repeat protein
MLRRRKTVLKQHRQSSAESLRVRNSVLNAALPSVLLVCGVLAVFLPAVKNDFVNFDDNQYIGENTHVQRGLTLEGIGWAFTHAEAANWHPATWISHMADCQLFGLKPWGHHLTNVLLHSVNTFLLFLLLQKLTREKRLSFFVAAFFGLHPLRVESVVWVSERKDVLSTFFLLLTIWAYSRYIDRVGKAGEAENRSTSVESRPGFSRFGDSGAWLFYILALVFFTLGLLSKQMLVTLPFALMLLDYWPLGRGTLSTSVLLEKIPFIVLAVGASAVAFLVQRHAGAVWDVARLSLGARIENAFVAYCRYIGKLVFPTDLSVFYPHPGYWPTTIFVGAVVIVFGLSWLAFSLRQRAPYATVGWFWFVGTLIPVIGLVQVGWQSLADRYTYIPSIGFFIVVVWGTAALAAAWQFSTGLLSAIGGLLLIVCGIFTERQLGYWKTSESLFRHSLAVTQNNYVANHNLGVTLLAQKRLDEAAAHFTEAIRLRPSAADSYNGLGEVLFRQGRVEDALKRFRQAVDLRPNLAVAHNNLGISLSKLGLVDEAIAEFQAAISARPDYGKAANNLGMALQAKGRTQEAIPYLREAVRWSPDDPEPLNNLAMALGRSGNVGEAITCLEKALVLNPDYSQAHHNLGLALGRQGRIQESVSHFERALELNPASAETHTSLAMVLAQTGRKQQAISHVQKALQLNPGYPPAEQLSRELGIK